MVKLTRSPKKPRIRYQCSKKWAITHFPQQAANSTANGELRSAAWKSMCGRILLALTITNNLRKIL